MKMKTVKKATSRPPHFTFHILIRRLGFSVSTENEINANIISLAEYAEDIRHKWRTGKSAFVVLVQNRIIKSPPLHQCIM